jgi:hypothetical protein
MGAVMTLSETLVDREVRSINSGICDLCHRDTILVSDPGIDGGAPILCSGCRDDVLAESNESDACPTCGAETFNPDCDDCRDQMSQEQMRLADETEKPHDEMGPPWDEIEIGDRVRSFDFALMGNRDLMGVRAAYVVGFVTDIQVIEGCKRYCILIDIRVWGGKAEDLRDKTHYVYPPVNGTPTSLGGICDGVELISRPTK